MISKIISILRCGKKKIKYIINQYFIYSFEFIHAYSPILKNVRGIILNYIPNFFLFFLIKPKFVSQVNYDSVLKPKKKTGILLQGLIDDPQFLIETIKMYKKLYPSSLIVISTWEYEKNKISHNIFKNCKIILNKTPKNFNNAWGNLNAQILTTNNGLKFLKSKKIIYSIKSRTDCRFLQPNLFSYLINLLQFYKNKKKNRIIFINRGSCKYKLFGISDIFLFGRTNDLLNYFDGRSYEKILEDLGFNIKKKYFIKNKTPIIAETALYAAYINKIYKKITWSLDFYWNSLRDLSIIIDENMIDHFWHKYNWRFPQEGMKMYSNKFDRYINFFDWKLIFLNKIKPKKNYLEKFYYDNLLNNYKRYDKFKNK